MLKHLLILIWRPLSNVTILRKECMHDFWLFVCKYNFKRLSIIFRSDSIFMIMRNNFCQVCPNFVRLSNSEWHYNISFSAENICAAQCCSLVYRCVNLYSINAYSTKEKTNKDDIVVEMKAKKTEESVLLKGVNGEQKPPNDQVTIRT